MYWKVKGSGGVKLKDKSGVDAIAKDMKQLCTTIGNRMAGSSGEQQAADYMCERLKELGITDAQVVPFSCTRWIREESNLVIIGDDSHPIACEPVANSRSTPEGGVEGELVFFESIDWESGLREGALDGKIGLFHGGYGESPTVFQQLHDSPLQALIFVDTRLQTDWPIANGMGERFMKIAHKPMAYISLMDAWNLSKKRVKAVRLCCRGRNQEATSWNVVGNSFNSDPNSKIILFSGHLDTVCVGVGADDNASGIVAVLECARRLKGQNGKFTLRFVGFGAEEQLSVGSTRYVQSQAEDIARIAFVCNFDSIGAWLGTSRVMVTGTRALENYMRGIITNRQGFASVHADACPYQDQFPFTRYGIPGIWYTRTTHAGGYWYHHSIHNNSDACSPERIALTAESACEVVQELLSMNRWPFRRCISPHLKKKTAAYVDALF